MASDYEGEDRRRWHVKKEISLGDIVAIASAVLAVLYAYTTLDKRISLLEVTQVGQQAVDAKQDGDALRYQSRIDMQLAEINRKLDRLIEARR